MAVNSKELIIIGETSSMVTSFYVKHFKLDKLNNNIEKTYFNCANGNRKYVCF